MIASLIVIQGVIQSVAQMTQAERKIMGAQQRRIGPNKVGFIGLLQPFADGIKLIQKETILPLESSNWIYIVAPFAIFYLAQLSWQVLPLADGVAISELLGGGIQILIAISEQGIYGIIFSGWASNSKYSFLGSIRSTAQLISYSVGLSLIIQTVIFTVGSVEPMEIMSAQRAIPQCFAQLPMVMMFMISAVAETNRAPFDLPEAESEQVAGHQTEYSAILFIFFFQAEYANCVTIATLFSILFFGVSLASQGPLPLIFFMQWQRASLARQRFDQQLRQGWSHFQPFVMGYIMFLPSFIFTFDILGLSAEVYINTGRFATKPERCHWLWRASWPVLQFEILRKNFSSDASI